MRGRGTRQARWDKAWPVPRGQRAPGTAPAALQRGLGPAALWNPTLQPPVCSSHCKVTHLPRVTFPTGSCSPARGSGVPQSLSPAVGPHLAPGACVPPAPEPFSFYLLRTWETFHRGTGNSSAHPHMQGIWLSWRLL